jgi:hypothetical protein
MANGQNARRAKSILNRFKEPSTWAGLAVLAGLFGVPLAPEQFQAVAQAGAAVAGGLAVFIPEGGQS